MLLLKIRDCLSIVNILLFCCSCVEDVNLAPKYEKKIVVNCILTTDSIQTLSLTYNNYLNKYYYDEVEDATATLYQDNLEIGKFEKVSFAKWQIKHTPILGEEYKLVVNVPGWSNIEATTTMPNPVLISRNASYDKVDIKYFTQSRLSNPYWMFVMKQKLDSIMVNPIVMPEDELKTSLGTNHPDCDGFNATDNMTFENKGTTREHLAYLRINPKHNEAQMFYIEAGMLSRSLVVFRTASYEYDKYMKSSVQKMMVYHTFDDPTQWFDENEIYSNINNGIGIFAAYSDKIVQIHDGLN